MPSGGACIVELTPPPATPLGVTEIAAALERIGGFEACPLVAVAVSGGPDSLALMLLADRWARARGGAAMGLTVDHGLRPESGEEARLVGGWLTARGIAHSVLRWQGEKPISGIQEAARTARYELLAGWCRDHGVLHLLTAHHREDQAETYLIRRRAGSGVDGLAAMAVLRELRGCRLVRPLLSVPRARLAAFLAAEQQPFLTDPSNLDPAFERARLRNSTRAASIEEIIDETKTNAERRIAREKALDRLIGRGVALHPAGFAALDAALLAAADAASAERLLAGVAACIGGGRYPVRRARLVRLCAELQAAAPRRVRTLGGCRFVPWRDWIIVLREVAAAAAPARIPPGAAILWDRRFAASLPAATETAAAATGTFSLGCLGGSGAALPGRPAVSLPPLVDPALPALRDDNDRLVAVPHLGYRLDNVCSLLGLSFRPVNPMVQAGFTVV